MMVFIVHMFLQAKCELIQCLQTYVNSDIVAAIWQDQYWYGIASAIWSISYPPSWCFDSIQCRISDYSKV